VPVRTPSFAVFLVMLGAPWAAACAQHHETWPVHSTDRPAPRTIRPGPFVTIAPPSDAVVLFDGSSVGAWRAAGSTAGPARWRVADGCFEVVGGTGNIATKRGFGDVQLHLEWAAPVPPTGTGQGRGNSGVFLMGLYEIQILDSYDNPTYPDGQAAAVYGQYPPLVNASRPPGEWQSYDIVFRRPRFGPDGALVRPAYITLFHNGALAQDHVALSGPTSHNQRPSYTKHPDKLPLVLQDHGNPVRFRNVWIRELEE
jgi:hypothetical protein